MMSNTHLDSLTLSLLADEMLDKNKAEDCLRHIATCKQCEQAYDDLLAMSFAMARLDDVAPPQGFDGFAQGILANLPEQDPVSKDNVVEIKEHRTKQSFFASLDLRQVVGYVACVALLSSFLYSPPTPTSVLRDSDSVDTVAPTESTSEEEFVVEEETAVTDMTPPPEMPVEAVEEPSVETETAPEPEPIPEPVPLEEEVALPEPEIATMDEGMETMMEIPDMPMATRDLISSSYPPVSGDWIVSPRDFSDEEARLYHELVYASSQTPPVVLVVEGLPDNEVIPSPELWGEQGVSSYTVSYEEAELLQDVFPQLLEAMAEGEQDFLYLLYEK